MGEHGGILEELDARVFHDLPQISRRIAKLEEAVARRLNSNCSQPGAKCLPIVDNETEMVVAFRRLPNRR